MKSFLKSYMSFLIPFYHQLDLEFRLYYGRVYKKGFIKYFYKRRLNREINLNIPRDFNEKINWLKIHSDMKIWAQLSDKYEVRMYLHDCGLEHALNQLYGVYEKVNEIDFNKLPQSFVIKTTNGGSGTEVKIIEDKSTLNEKSLRNYFKAICKPSKLDASAEFHYKYIKPRIIIEKFLKQSDNSPLVDYKIHCFNGEPFVILVCSDRVFGKSVKLTLYDLDWNPMFDKLISKSKGDKIVAKPKGLTQMLEYSRILAKPFPQVRVDWYEIDGKIIFGELTFTPAGGFIGYYSCEFLKEIGDKIDLNYPI